MNHRKFALIPAYQPDERLTALCSALKEKNYTVVVVDDGSGAAYAPIFESVQPGAAVLSYAPNRSKGAALRTGLAHIQALAAPGDVVVTADADGQHRPEDVEKTVRAAESEPTALTLGSRAFTGRVPLKSRLGNSITWGVFGALAHRRVRDTQTGLRAFYCGMIPFMLDVRGDRYEYEMNVLLKCAQQNVPIREVPIETVYIDGNASSHFHPVRDAWRIYREIFAFAASSFAGFLTDYALFSLLSALLGSAWLPLCNILARIVSATVNYTLNRRYVFRDSRGVMQSAPRYALLAAAILGANTLLLMLLAGVLHLNRYAAKLIVEILLFAVSWAVQKTAVFARRRTE